MNTNYGDDHSRPLSTNGIKAVKKMGLFLSEKGTPDLVISSTATRANTTANLAMNSGRWSCPFVLESGIYGGVPSFLLDLVNRQDDEMSSICLVGHEPNFSGFISDAISSHQLHFPPASMVKINFNVIHWNEVVFGIGILDWLVNPSGLK